ncbi:hypothetical protein DMS96_28825 [Klebsiella variicola]|nr:hypothetical protein DMS96_28825 [Klebsiella variicola]
MQLHQQKGMISLSPPTICNSADCPILIGEAAGADKPQARQSPPSVFSRLRSRTMSRSTACRRSRCRRSEATC